MKNKPAIRFLSLGILFFVTWQVLGANGFCQQNQENPAKENEPDETFFHLGYISYSSAYTLSQDRLFITFKIKNNASRPISNIFAWVYRYKESKEGEASAFLLVNNPNRGGILVRGGMHPSGETAEWRFPLIRAKEPVDPQEKYSLRVSPKSVFFGDGSLK